MEHTIGMVGVYFSALHTNVLKYYYTINLIPKVNRIIALNQINYQTWTEYLKYD